VSADILKDGTRKYFLDVTTTDVELYDGFGYSDNPVVSLLATAANPTYKALSDLETVIKDGYKSFRIIMNLGSPSYHIPIELRVHVSCSNSAAQERRTCVRYGAASCALSPRSRFQGRYSRPPWRVTRYLTRSGWFSCRSVCYLAAGRWGRLASKILHMPHAPGAARDAVQGLVHFLATARNASPRRRPAGPAPRNTPPPGHECPATSARSSHRPWPHAPPARQEARTHGTAIMTNHSCPVPRKKGRRA
jgi:hypothetical protein